MMAPTKVKRARLPSAASLESLVSAADDDAASSALELDDGKSIQNDLKPSAPKRGRRAGASGYSKEEDEVLRFSLCSRC